MLDLVTVQESVKRREGRDISLLCGLEKDGVVEILNISFFFAIISLYSKSSPTVQYTFFDLIFYSLSNS